MSDFFTSKIFLATILLPVTVAWSPPLVPLLLENVSDCVNSTYFHLLESRLLSSILIGGLLITTDTLVQRHHVFIALWKRRLGIPTVFLSTSSLHVSLRWMSCTGLYNADHHQYHTVKYIKLLIKIKRSFKLLFLFCKGVGGWGV